MDAPQIIFDRALCRERLSRALLRGAADFLFETAVDECLARISAVNRTFSAALDLASPLPGLAASLAQQGSLVFRAAPVCGGRDNLVADVEALPFSAGAFDLIASLLALQTANDLPGALAQIRRCLQPDGLFIGCLLGGRSLYELRAAFTEAEVDLTGGASPRVAPLADVRDVGRLLQRAGFALPVADSEPVTVRYDSMFGLIADLRAMGATNPLVARARAPLARAVLHRAAQLYAARFADSDGRVRATFEMVWMSGWGPHPSQQKPLKPGSAQVRLADALASRAKA